MISAAFIHKHPQAWRRLGKYTALALAALAFVGLAAPFVDASAYGERIRQTLQTTLGRPVQFEAVHFNLFSGPGFSLEGVTIGDDPQYGIEPFAYVPEMKVRVRPDKLLFGRVQISSLRLEGPSLNFVKRGDGTWNALELVERLSAPSRLPVNFFPVFEVREGRIDFKFGSRKTTLYLLNSDLQIYPERSHRLSIHFSGSPARTDRAGNGFGHMQGDISWYTGTVNPKDNQLEADLILDPSNLSEMTTLIEGHDAGLHGTVSTHLRVSGQLNSLDVHGQLQLSDVHRWDLMPASGSAWQVRYRGSIDLLSDRLTLETQRGNAASSSPVIVNLQVDDLFRNPRPLLSAHLQQVPVGEILPLARRLGLLAPPNLTLIGTMQGDIQFAGKTGLTGKLLIENVMASLPQVAPLQIEQVEAELQNDRIAFRPSHVQTEGGELVVGGAVWLSAQHATTSLVATDYPVEGFKQALGSWLGIPAPLAPMAGGTVNGSIQYTSEAMTPAVWSGRLDVQGTTLQLPGLSAPLRNASGRLALNGDDVDVTRFTARAGERTVQASYHSNPLARRAEHLHVDLPAAELGELQTLLAPIVQGQGLLTRLGVTRRSVPAWMAARDMDADINVKQLFVDDAPVGSLAAAVTWQGTTLRVASLSLAMPAATVRARGLVNLAAYRPRCEFSASVQDYPWLGGTIDAEGSGETSGLGQELLQNLKASGHFAGQQLHMNADEVFPAVSGAFLFAYRNGSPDLTVPALQVSDREGEWTGLGSAQADGHLLITLERAGQQKRVVGLLSPDESEPPGNATEH